MQSIKRASIQALCAFVLLSGPASADNRKLAGLWKLVSFQVEDVASKTVSNVYGEHPRGYLSLTSDGRFHAYAFRAAVGPEPSLYDDIACSRPCEASDSGIIYAGTYRLDGSTFVMRVSFAQNEGPVGVGPFDLTWTEGRTASEERRPYQLEEDRAEGMILKIETPPMTNPNGAGNTIVGRVVWERE